LVYGIQYAAMKQHTSRPNLTVALATCADHPGLCAGDDEALAEQLAAEGIRAETARWDDHNIDWAQYDAVLIRTTWDYTERVEEFLAWMRRVEAATPVFNPSATAEANLHKSYLKLLGAAAVPTLWAEPGADAGGVLAAAAARGWDSVAVKPAVGAGAEDLLIAPLTDAEALRRHIAGIHQRCAAMVQPLIEGVRERGELSVVLIDGEATHAVRKTPTAGDYRVQIEFGGAYEPEDPAPAALEIVRAAGALWDDPPLYARVDLVEPEPGEYLIIEVELVEPELFFPWAAHAGAKLGTALRRRLAARSTMGA